MSQPSYKIYPSLLDAFQKFVDTTPENAFYKDEDGKFHMNYSDETGYHLTDEEVYEQAKKELIDKINRVPFTSTALSKGTAFNEVVDSLIHSKRPDENVCTIAGNRAEEVINVSIGDETFKFSWPFIESVAERFKGSLSQVHTSATLNTKYGDVLLYGYIDEIIKNKVYDLKTTSRGYEFGQYEHYWQRYVYPYCLIESGMVTDIESFEFTCYVLKGGTSKTPVITGECYPEVYNHNQEKAREKLTLVCERLIEFLEENRSLITDKKVFGGDKD